MPEWNERIDNKKIAEMMSYDQIDFGKGIKINAIDTKIVDPPDNSWQDFLVVNQFAKGKPTDNLIRSVNNFIKTGKPIYVLQFEKDFLKHFDKFEPKHIENFEPIPTEQNGETAYFPDEDFYAEYIKEVNQDMKEYLKSGVERRDKKYDTED